MRFKLHHPKRGSSLQMRLSLDGNRKGFERLWGCGFMIVIWPSVYIHPMESMIPEQELSKRVMVSLRSNTGVPRVWCDSNRITPKRGSNVQATMLCYSIEESNRHTIQDKSTTKHACPSTLIYSSPKILSPKYIRNGFMPHIMGYKFITYLCPWG